MFMNGIRIYITGFMTSGKSTIGPILANVLGMEFIDLDKEIEEREHLTVVEIFAKKGEGYFRNLEKTILENLGAKNNIIVALGGGTITFQENLDLLKRTGKIIYLQVSPNILYLRLKNKTNRPLFLDLVLGENNEEDFLSRINEMLDKRKEYYEQADLIINTDNNPIGVTVDKLAKKILRMIHEYN
jgi:shikimate kinase